MEKPFLDFSSMLLLIAVAAWCCRDGNNDGKRSVSASQMCLKWASRWIIIQTKRLRQACFNVKHLGSFVLNNGWLLHFCYHDLTTTSIDVPTICLQSSILWVIFSNPSSFVSYQQTDISDAADMERILDVILCVFLYTSINVITCNY